MYNVHYFIPRGSAVVRLLIPLVADHVKLTAGLSSAWMSQCDLLIAATPPHKALTSPLLKTLVIPCADVPSPTRETLRRARPLPVYTVHFNCEAVAETAIALWLAAAKELLSADRSLRLGKWSRKPAVRIRDSRVVVLGCGRIGQQVCRLATALGGRVTAVTRRYATTVIQGVDLMPFSRLAELLPQADVLISCLSLTESTANLMNRDRLALLPPSSLIVNVGRAAPSI
jgi:phosphoglycerate dehydrogenase-like enzyme